MKIEKIIASIENSPHYQGQICYRRRLPGRRASFAPSDQWPPAAADYLSKLGIERLYTHQAEALTAVQRGENIVVVTPTASGKTLCYNLPVLSRLGADKKARALYLFPTKALTQDQLAAVNKSGLVSAAVYDGDTPNTIKPSIRDQAQLVLTNPDMLHLGILPNHLKWHRFFSQLQYVVIDEIHSYRGVFGTQVAHVIRRLRRLAREHGAQPQFILTSATIANPEQHAQRLIGLPVTLIAGNGAPQGEREFIFWQVPKNRTYIDEAVWLLITLFRQQARTIAFARARQVVERIRRRVQQDAADVEQELMAYRGGYLPSERRAIEADLFSGRLTGVVATNALELGIDVGAMDVCLIAGYPGTIASTWQQSGRVGRRQRPALVIFMAVANPLDQYFLQRPQALFEKPAESALIDTSNPYLLLGQARCAAHELPLASADLPLWDPVLSDLLTILEQDGELVASAGRWYYLGQDYPAQAVNLRTCGSTYILRDQSQDNRLLGTMDGSTAFSEAHPGAIYLHQGETFQAEKLDLDRKIAYLRPADVDYYTLVSREKKTEILTVMAEKEMPGYKLALGQLKVRTKVNGFIKKHERSGQILGKERLTLPEQVLETRGMWLLPAPELVAAVQAAGLDLMGGLHAVEHAAIALLPLVAMCDRNDVGGLSASFHAQTERPTIFIHDAHQGGVGFAEQGYRQIQGLLWATLLAVAGCACDRGCPSCIYSPKCSNFNRPLDKKAAIMLLQGLVNLESGPHGQAGVLMGCEHGFV